MKDLKIKITGSGDKYVLARDLEEIAYVIRKTLLKTWKRGLNG
jgi:hypothetical protein